MSVTKNEGFERKRQEVRLRVLERDRGKCQWPGCNANSSVEVLFLVHTDAKIRKVQQFDNGITVCQKHKEMVFLDEILFAPFLADLIKLIEFEQDIQRIEEYIRTLGKRQEGS